MAIAVMLPRIMLSNKPVVAASIVGFKWCQINKGLLINTLSTAIGEGTIQKAIVPLLLMYCQRKSKIKKKPIGSSIGRYFKTLPACVSLSRGEPRSWKGLFPVRV